MGVCWARCLVVGVQDHPLVEQLLSLGKERNPQHRSTLVAAAHHQNREVRAMAVRALGWLRMAEVVDDLVPSLDDMDTNVRRWTAASLALTGSRRSGPQLISRLMIEEHEAVRVALLRTLGWLEVSSARPVMIDILNSDAPAEVRGQAISSLCRLRAIDTAPLWVKALGDPAGTVRCQALRALATCPDLSLETELDNLAQDDDPEVRLLALRTMAQRRTPGIERRCVLALSDGNPGVRATALICLKTLSYVDALEPIETLKADPHSEVRHHARLASIHLRALRAH